MRKSWPYWLILVVVIAGVGWYLTIAINQTNYDLAHVTDYSIRPVYIKPDPYKGWKTYTNPKLAASFKYPPDWKLAENTNTDLGVFSVHLDDMAAKTDVFASRVTFYDSGPGIGCGESTPTTSESFTVGGVTKAIEDFCGSVTDYALLVKIGTNSDASIFINFKAASDTVKNDVRLIVKSLTNSSYR